MKLDELIDLLGRHRDLNLGSGGRSVFDQVGVEVDAIGVRSGVEGLVLFGDGWVVVEDVSSWAFFEGIFSRAGVGVLGHFELSNGYWPDTYIRLRLSNPWWLVKTERGLVTVGWRKRVISIGWDWVSPSVVTGDEVSKGCSFVHAGSAEKAVEYLRALMLL